LATPVACSDNGDSATGDEVDVVVGQVIIDEGDVGDISDIGDNGDVGDDAPVLVLLESRGREPFVLILFVKNQKKKKNAFSTAKNDRKYDLNIQTTNPCYSSGLLDSSYIYKKSFLNAYLNNNILKHVILLRVWGYM